MKRKIISIIVLIFMLFALTGCEDFDWNSFFNIPGNETTEPSVCDETEECTIEEPQENDEECEEAEECPTCDACETYEECPTCETCETCDECLVCEECETCEECVVCEECATCEECPTCEECEECEISDFTWEQLMQTRAIVRESNIFIRTKKYSVDRWGNKTLQSTSLGSGVVYKSQEGAYFAITNHHVINPGDFDLVEYEVTTFFDHVYVGTVVISDSTKDLAIITFIQEEEITPLNIEYRLEKPLATDEFVFAVGNPSGVQNVVTFGTYVRMSYIGNVEFLVIYHNALIYPGNSGGALTDLYGNLVGINTWGVESNDEINYAVPLAVVYGFLEEHELS